MALVAASEHLFHVPKAALQSSVGDLAVTLVATWNVRYRDNVQRFAVGERASIWVDG